VEIFPLTSPNQSIGGDVSPASPAALTPVRESDTDRRTDRQTDDVTASCDAVADLRLISFGVFLYFFKIPLNV